MRLEHARVVDEDVEAARSAATASTAARTASGSLSRPDDQVSVARQRRSDIVRLVGVRPEVHRDAIPGCRERRRDRGTDSA